MVALVMVAAIATAAAMVMVTVTAAWALAFILVLRSTGWAITPLLIILTLPTHIPHPHTPIPHRRWHLLAHTLSRAMHRRHRPRSKTGTTARVPMPITRSEERRVGKECR